MEDGPMDLSIEAYHDIEVDREQLMHPWESSGPGELELQVDPSYCTREFIERSSVQATKLSWWYHIHMVHSIVT